MTLSQSKTGIAATPPPTDCNKVQPDTLQTTSGRNAASQEQEKRQKQRLQLYNSLFGQEKDKNNVCDNTGLQLTSSLNYSLYTITEINQFFTYS